MKRTAGKLTAMIVCASLAISLALLSPAKAQSESYTYTIIDLPGIGVDKVCVQGINNNGWMVGTYYTPGSQSHGFIYNGSHFTTLDFPDATAGTLPTGINDSNIVVGKYSCKTGDSYIPQIDHGFLYDGVFTTIDFPDAFSTSVGRINNKNQIIGSYVDSDLRTHGFVHDCNSKNFTSIDFPGAKTTTLSGINDAGWIVGQYSGKEGTGSFLYDGGGFEKINVPGAPIALVKDINNAGLMVGFSNTDYPHAILYNPNTQTVQTIDIPGFNRTLAQDINDAGVVAGMCCNAPIGTKPWNGFLLQLGGNQPPTASFTLSPAHPVIGQEITFDASSSSDPDGQIISYQWFLGDNTTGEGKTVKHAFSKAGMYRVVLLATDNAKYAGSCFVSIQVTPPKYGAQRVLMRIGETTFYADDKLYSLDVAPFIKDNRTFVPVRFLAEAFGAEADWEPKDASPQIVTLARPDNTLITICIGSKSIKVDNGGTVTTIQGDVAAFIKDDRTVLPFRIIAEAFGAEVDYGPKDAAVEWVSFEQ